MQKTGDHLLVAAIDFGTTYSGYAFSMRHEFKTDPLKIHANQAWNSGGRALLSLKTPTCLLLNDRKELDSFGYEAENKYADIVMDDEQDNYYYFHRFKMNLHNNTKITSGMVLEDIRGKSVPAIEVFGLSIKALVSHLTDILDKQGTGMDKSEIQWVLTVPAIWTDAAKQFMRKSAVNAGIPEESLKIALEPEAASIFCQYLPTKKLHGADEGFTMTEPGAKYMVVDLGGGTADITVHEKLANGQLKELCRATGNDCGGTSVDGRFFQMLVKIFGGPLMKKIKDEDPSAYLDLFREFETVKRTITPEKDTKVNITIPYASLDAQCKKVLGENLPDVLESSPYSNQLTVRGDKMRVEADLMRSLFNPTIDSIISLMKDILQNKATSEVSQLLLVGGFSECMLIQAAVKRNFKQKRVIIPEEAGLSVLKGAVLFGHRPEYIRSRVMQLSYGVETRRVFNSKIHDKKYLVENETPPKCEKIFKQIVKKDQEVSLGEKFITSHLTAFPMQKEMPLHIYVSTEKTPMYIDESSCTYLGSATITFPTPTEETREVTAEYIFGNTEIGMTAVDKTTGTKINASFDLI
ncbi:heat shock 70 kDa protein 12A-like [Mytilus galloprovincialis]|uniref:heat shock 70 kDa protein 12A-like n=1 Tax=Mytilus galloprovincialis TaxID=29158 RepID=UPI003F7B7EEB